MTDRTFDYSARLDPRNLAYRAGVADSNLLDRARYWAPSTRVLDQGSEGACVGFGVAHEYGASPVRGKVTDQLARDVYREAQRIDEWPGEAPAYEGTSVRAGMLVGRERGWWSGFSWALNMSELRATLELGPVVVGVEWREGMYEAPGGVVTVDGPVVGGHCLLLTGYSPNWRRRGPHYRWRNSWGGGSTGYGANGSAYIAADGLDTILFGSGGEAAVPTGRSAGT